MTIQIYLSKEIVWTIQGDPYDFYEPNPNPMRNRERLWSSWLNVQYIIFFLIFFFSLNENNNKRQTFCHGQVNVLHF